MIDLEYKNFYYRFGVRTKNHLDSPALFGLDKWAIPRNVLIHYIPHRAVGDNPSANHFSLRDYSKRPLIYHVTQMTGDEGAPRRNTAININAVIMGFRRRERTFIPAVNWERSIQNNKLPMIANYSFIPMQYRYLNTPYARMFRFNNMMSTIADEMKRIADISDRHQLVFLNVPKVLPTKMQFNKSLEAFEEMGLPLDEIPAPSSEDEDFIVSLEGLDEFKGIIDEELLDNIEREAGYGPELVQEETLSLENWNRTTLSYFPDDDTLYLTEIWKLISDEPEKSKFYRIGVENLKKITLVFIENGRFRALNLGWLWDFRHGEKANISFGAATTSMLKFFESIRAAGTPTDKTVVRETIPENEGDTPQTLSVKPQEAVVTGVADGKPVNPNAALNAVQDAVAAVASAKVVGKDGVMAPEEDKAPDVPHAEIFKPIELTEEEEKEILNISQTGPDARISQRSERLLKDGLISVAEHKRHLTLAQSYKKIKAPNGQTLEEFMVVPEKEVWDYKPVKMLESEHIVDKSMQYSTMKRFDRNYVEKVAERDTVGMLLKAQDHGIAITDFKVDEKVDALNHTKNYTVRFAPIYGQPTTWNFQMPVVNRNGEFKLNGVKYYMRKLRGDKPIRKINKSTVALTTFYGKLFVTRSEAVRSDLGEWLCNELMVMILIENGPITDIHYGNTFKEDQPVPRLYSAISARFPAFTFKGIRFLFNYPKLTKNFKPEVIKAEANRNRVPCGIDTKTKHVVTIDKNGNLYKGDTALGDLINFFGLNEDKAPVESVGVEMFKKDIPMAIVFCYLLGISKTVKLLGVEPVRRMRGTRSPKIPNSFDIHFQDEIWTFPKGAGKVSLIWASMNRWASTIKRYPMSAFDDKSVFTPIFQEKSLGSRFLKEIDLIDSLFIDPISAEILRVQMKEPDEIKALFIRSAEMLVDDLHRNERETDGILIKGYERMNGAAYRSMVDGVRAFQLQPVTSRARVDINPFKVIDEIKKDPSVSIVEDSNVIHNIKQKDALTYTGTGGRSKLSMVRRTRAFHPSDIGVRSEASVDSGDVGVNVFMPFNPNITSLRGTVQSVDPKVAGAAQMISAAMVASPFASYDDGKRVNFITVQQDHVVSINGSSVSPTRTGGEIALAGRCGDLFAFMSEGAGKVTEVSDTHLVIKYDDPELGEERIELGRIFGTVAGHVVPHMVVTDYKVGQKFGPGEVLSYNSGFFARDWRDPKQALWKTGALTWVAFLEKDRTYEDSSYIAKELADKMFSPVAHTKTIIAKFTDNVFNLVNIGEELDIDDEICSIEEGMIAEIASLNDTAVDDIRALEKNIVRSKFVGKVEGIEVIYFGDKEDMTPSLAKIANKYDALRAKKSKELGPNVAKTGQISNMTRVDGQPIEIDMIAIRVTITHDASMADGDKLVLCNQLKSVNSGVMPQTLYTQKAVLPGQKPVPIGIQFSYKGVQNRIVLSTQLIGMSNALLECIQNAMVAAYFG